MEFPDWLLNTKKNEEVGQANEVNNMMKMKAFKKELHYLVINCFLQSVCLPVGVSIGLDLIHYFEMTAFPPFLVSSLHPVTKSSVNKQVYRKLI